MKKPNWDNFLLVVAKSLEVFVKVMAVLIAPRLQFQAQVTVAHVTGGGEFAKSYVRRSACSTYIRAAELPVVFVSLT